MYRLIYFIVFLFSFVPYGQCSENKPLNVSQLQFDDQIYKQGFFYEDVNGKSAINDILNNTTEVNFQSVRNGGNNFGYSGSTFWFKLDIATDSLKPNLVLACENTTINFIDFYLVDENGSIVKQVHTGNERPFSTREFDNRYFIFEVPLQAGKHYQIFVSIASQDAIDFSLVMANYRQYFNYQYTLQLIEGIYFGAIIIMGLYNLFLFLVILDIGYLYYVLYIVSTLLFQFELGGWFNQYFMRDFPSISNKMGGVFLSFVVLFIMLFLEGFTGKTHYSKFMRNAFYAIKCIALAQILTCIFIPLKYNLPFFIIFCVFGVIPCILYAIFKAHKQGVTSTKFLVIGWSSISFGGIMYGLASLGFVPFNFFATYSIQIGTILELLFLSFALADRINILRIEKQMAQRETIIQLQENAQLLKRLNEEQKKAFGAVIQGEENERKRLAFELHDGIGQLLSVVKLNLSSLEQWADKRNKQTANVVNSIVTLVDDSCTEIRNISHNLMPNSVVQFGLIAALQDFCRKINNAQKIKIHFQNQDFEPDLPPQLQTITYRVVQEIVHNAMRHSQASDVYIQLFTEDEYLVILIEDNGIGFDKDNMINGSDGIGIKNIISRVEYMKGDIHIETSLGKGTMYNIHLNMYLQEN